MLSIRNYKILSNNGRNLNRFHRSISRCFLVERTYWNNMQRENFTSEVWLDHQLLWFLFFPYWKFFKQYLKYKIIWIIFNEIVYFFQIVSLPLFYLISYFEFSALNITYDLSFPDKQKFIRRRLKVAWFKDQDALLHEPQRHQIHVSEPVVNGTLFIFIYGYGWTLYR